MKAIQNLPSCIINPGFRNHIPDRSGCLTNSIQNQYLTETSPSVPNSIQIQNTLRISNRPKQHKLRSTLFVLSVSFLAVHSLRSRVPLPKKTYLPLPLSILAGMEAQNNQHETQPASAAKAPVVTSCRKKKSDDATFLQDVKDHIDEFIHASMDEHKTCFTKTIKKMFGMSKVVAERNSNSEGVESSLPLQTTIAN
uniref:Uncharacterized protein n=2 Tax=Vitis vinifera TaxID=29760 RepID=F6HQM7_VITVI